MLDKSEEMGAALSIPGVYISYGFDIDLTKSGYTCICIQDNRAFERIYRTTALDRVYYLQYPNKYV